MNIDSINDFFMDNLMIVLIIAGINLFLVLLYVIYANSRHNKVIKTTINELDKIQKTTCKEEVVQNSFIDLQQKEQDFSVEDKNHVNATDETFILFKDDVVEEKLDEVITNIGSELEEEIHETIEKLETPLAKPDIEQIEKDEIILEPVKKQKKTKRSKKSNDEDFKRIQNLLKNGLVDHDEDTKTAETPEEFDIVEAFRTSYEMDQEENSVYTYADLEDMFDEEDLYNDEADELIDLKTLEKFDFDLARLNQELEKLEDKRVNFHHSIIRKEIEEEIPRHEFQNEAVRNRHSLTYNEEFAEEPLERNETRTQKYDKIADTRYDSYIERLKEFRASL